MEARMDVWPSSCFSFAYFLVGRPKDAVPVIRGTSLHGESVVARNTREVRHVRLAEERGTDLAQYRPLLFHGNVISTLTQFIRFPVLRGFNLSLSKRHC